MFTPVESTIGALLLHQATSVLLFQNGTVLGASGYVRKLFSSPTKETVGFLAGMAASILPLKAFVPETAISFPPGPATPYAALITLGVGALVGWGTKLSSGCTSGHMLCGLSRLNAWSAVTVATFFPIALITHHLIHPTLLTEVCTGNLPCYTPVYPSSATAVSLLSIAAITIFLARNIPQIVANTALERKLPLDITANETTQFFAGLEFGLGLHMTQMAHPAKVASFLSFPNLAVWDPSMALIIVFGILPSLIEIQSRGFSKPPRFNNRFVLPKKTLKDADWKHILGAAGFGIGWGLTGTCPGPAVLRAFSQPSWGLLWIGGFWLGGLVVADRDQVEAEGTCG